MRIRSKLLHSAVQYIAFTLICTLCSFAQAATCEKSWPAWDSFKKALINEEGRVTDGSTEHTTSEGQAYAMFFALVANDRVTFDKLLNWTSLNQSQDDLTSHLPSWDYGKSDEERSVVLDENSASDADLWMAYALGEAGRLWTNRRYIALSSVIADRILAKETLNVPGLGLVLLPGAAGFTPTPTSVRLNPSYVPLQLMHWFAAHSKDTRWAALLNSSRQLILQSSPNGYAPDWTVFDYERGFLPDTNAIGSYDAIRVYLWAGMLSRDDADQRLLLDAFRPMARFVDNHGYPPESIDTLTGKANNEGPIGFSAAMLPLLQALGLNKAAQAQMQRMSDQPISEDHYYNQVLSLYALGWHENLYRFDPKGNLTPRWMSSCP